MKRLKQLSRDSLIYGVGAILAKSVSFLLLPIYTRIFSPEEYGSIEMLILISGFFGAVMMMGLDSAQSMYFFKYKDEGKSKQAQIISSILQWRLVWGSGVVLVATIITPSIYAVLFNSSLKIEHFFIAFVSTFFAQILSQSIEIFRLLYRPWSFILVSVAEIIMAAILILSFVLIFDYGIFGFFIGSAISGLIISFFSWFFLREYLTFSRVHYNWWPMLLKFGAPLVPAEAALFLMSTLDRWFINFYYGSEALGLFAVSAKFSLIIAATVGVFRKAWWPIAMDSMHSDDGPETFRLISRLYIGLGSALGIIMVMLMPWLLKVFTAPVYHNTWPIASILVWQAILYGFFLIGSAGLWKRERTDINLYLMITAAIVGIFFNWLLVPLYGSYGAAVATVITYLFWNMITMFVSNYLWPIKIPFFLLGFKLILALSFTMLYTLNVDERYIENNLVHSLGFIVIITLIILTIPPSIKRNIFVKFKS
ncbi:oligosaccharide flippase family protein [Gammaproteobacteria bacterium]|nr:oligosaccharide flippase family protein [Gammaproteobacteria bacterium]MDC3312945.1 oligosaccharide flippase family protein [Gammaproteobacteria bacterium]